MADSTRLVLIRHGESRATVDEIVGGHDGCQGLTDRGRRQAEALRDRLGATGSRLLSGHDAALDDLETIFSSFAGTEAALYFSSGFAANTGLLSALLTPGDGRQADRHHPRVHANAEEPKDFAIAAVGVEDAAGQREDHLVFHARLARRRGD